MVDRFALAFLTFAVVAVASGRARADIVPSRPAAVGVAVLDVDTDDADDQAEALTEALRSRVRASATFSLTETTQSLAKLIVVLKCPPRPDAACEQRIADTLKTDRFVWGQMSKHGNNVSAEVHLWARGKPATRASETYTDNLKDPTDAALEKIAARLFATLTGGSPAGKLSIHASVASGEVRIDGIAQGKVEGGVAHVVVPTGAHSVEVVAEGFAPWTHAVTIAMNEEQELDATLSPANADFPTLVGAAAAVPWRRVATYASLGAGAASMLFGAVEGARFLSLRSALNDDRAKVAPSVQDVCADKSTLAAIDACKNYQDAQSARQLEIFGFGIGAALIATGVVLLVTDRASEEPSEAKTGAVNVIPRMSRTSGGVDVRVTF